MRQDIKERMELIKNGKVPDGYKKTKLGIIPQKWNCVCLKDVAEISSGSTPSRNQDCYWNGTIPWITTSEIDYREIKSANEYITEKSLEKFGLKLYKKGTILMAMYGQGKTRGKMAVLATEAAINQACAAIIVKKENFMFIYQQLAFLYEEIRRMSNSGGQKNLNSNIVKNILLIMPDLNEQKKIVDILKDYDGLIDKMNLLLTKKRLEQKWLIQNVLTGKIRFPGLSSEWRKMKLSEVLTKQSDKKGILDIQICSVAVKKGVINQIVHMGRVYASDDTSHYNVVRYGDIVYTKSPTGEFPYGIIKQSFIREKVAVSPLYGVFRARNFALGYLLHTYFQEKGNVYNYLHPLIKKGAKNTINITNDEFLNNSISLPTDIKTQEKLADVFMLVDKEIALLEKKLELMKQEKKAMMQLLLTGIVRVSET